MLQVDSDYSASTLINQAYVAGDSRDPDTSNNIASATTNISTQTSLSISKIDLIDPVLAGETIPYQIRVTNDGPSDATNVLISDNIPVNTTFAGASDICSEAGGVITCNVGDLTAGEDYSVFIELRVDDSLADGSTITNSAIVSADNAATDSDDAQTTVNQPALNPTDLEISKSDTPSTVVAGESVTYTIVITNNGPTTATNVSVVDALPNGVSAQSVTASQGLCNLLAICDLGDVAVGANATVTIVGTVDSDQTGLLTNNARVSASNPDSDDSNNEASTTTAVTVDDALALSKVGPASVSPNGAIAYQIVISNTGPSDATGVVLSDTLPTFVTNAIASASSGSCSIAGGLLTCNLGTLSPSQGWGG